MSFLSLRSFNLSPSPSRKTSPDPSQSQLLGKSYSTSPRPSVHFTPRLGRKSMKKFFKKPSFFNKIQDNEEKEPPVIEPSYLGQIYKNAKLKLSLSLKSKSSSSSQVNYCSVTIVKCPFKFI